MKKLVLICFLMGLVIFGFSEGQSQQRPERPSVEEMIKKAKAELGLSDAQVNSWQEIHKKYGKPAGDRTKMEESRLEMVKELEATLTAEQKEKFRKMRPNQGPPRKGGGQSN
ncbi:MAG: hypothetical protein ACI8YP_001538 [Algoriphagus sp.]|jgi:hypothetical protein